jgi:hypothetical protein
MKHTSTQSTHALAHFSEGILALFLKQVIELLLRRRKPEQAHLLFVDQFVRLEQAQKLRLDLQELSTNKQNINTSSLIVAYRIANRIVAKTKKCYSTHFGSLALTSRIVAYRIVAKILFTQLILIT